MSARNILDERRQNFVDALTGGKYIQLIGALKDDEGKMCAVGLACELSTTGNWENLVHESEGESVEYGYPEEFQYYHIEGENDRKNSKVPVSVLNYYGWSRDIIDWLIDMNDEEQFEFPQIANLIRNRFGLN